MTSFRNIPEPETTKQVTQFVSAVAFYANIIPGFSDIAQPLRDLVKAENFDWKDIHTRAFVRLKDKLCNKVLKAFDPEQDVELCCDASSVAVGVVLSQGGRPVFFNSKTLSKAERNYSQLDREGLVSVYAVKRLHK